MAGMGYAVMGTAMRGGANRATEAAHAAMSSPLLEEGAIDGARGILINISGSSALKLSEVNEASTIIQNSAHEDANIIFGAVLDESLGDEVKITVIATGFRHSTPTRGERLSQSLTASSEQSRECSGSRKSTTGKPRFASEIAEEASPAHASYDEDDFQQASRVPVAQQETATAVRESYATAPNPGTLNGAGRENVMAVSAEMEDRQLDVPAYLRRNELS